MPDVGLREILLQQAAQRNNDAPGIASNHWSVAFSHVFSHTACRHESMHQVCRLCKECLESTARVLQSAPRSPGQGSLRLAYEARTAVRSGRSICSRQSLLGLFKTLAGNLLSTCAVGVKVTNPKPAQLHCLGLIWYALINRHCVVQQMCLQS